LRQIIVVFALATASVLSSIASPACTKFGRDDTPVEKVQSSWAPADAAMSHYRYAEALQHLNSTYGFLAAIKDPFTRQCVADGALQRISIARAGEQFLLNHPGDDRGAKLAADQAQRVFPMMHNCT